MDYPSRVDRNEVLEILSAKLRTGAITRRQFAQAAAMVGLGGGVLAPRGASAAPGTARRVARKARQEGGSEVRFLIAEPFWADWHQYLSTAQSQWRVGRQIYDTLIQIESDDFSAYTPGLAETWTQLDDTTWEFTLRQGVTFHNGQPFTGADVKASIELATGATPEETQTASRWVPTTVEVVDEFTVRLTTASPFAPMQNELSRLPILCAADIQAGTEALKAAPNGTGPFKLSNDEQAIKTMAANEAYWGGAPAIGTLVWEYITDGQTRLNAFLDGQAHAIDRVPPEHVVVLQATPDVSMISVTGFENVNLWMRQDAPAPWDAANVKLREAVAWSIDRQALVTSLVGGASQVSVTHIPNNAVYAAPQEPAYSFDPERAKAALVEAGFPDAGPALPLWGASGFLPRGKEVTESIANSLEQTGFVVELQVTELGALIDGLLSEDKQGLFFHLSWSSNGDPHGALATLYKAPGVWAGASDAQIDELIEQGFATVDPEARAAVYAELQTYLWQNLVHIPLYNSDLTIGHASNLSGVTVLPNFDTIFKKATLAG